ncbi:MAG: ABC transporter permease subunit [Defluviitaleaceae bacterium]|nr:ABC transporter permease subunit [Defluviitaleaceae bacterium]
MEQASTKPAVSARLRNYGLQMWKARFIYLLALPGIVYLAIFQYGPMYGVLMAFQNFRPRDGIMGSQWVGLANFQRFFDHPHFWRLISNTVILNVYQLLFVFPLPIIFALLLNELRGKRFKKTVQTVSYLPNFISMPAIIGMMIMFVSPTDGFVNRIIVSLGGEAVHFMARPEWFRPLFIISEIWTTLGWAAIIYIAALAGVNPELYESAVIDGASRLKMMRHISIPSIAPTIIILFLLNVGTIMSLGHEKALLMQNSLNLETGEIISTFVFRRGLESLDYSFATAVQFFNSIINIAILTIANTISRRVSETSLW